jgi:ATP-binding cassette, subfamily B, bacterial
VNRWSHLVARLRRGDGSVKSTTRLLRPFLARRWRALAGAGGASVVVSAAELARPFPLALVVDHLLEGRNGPFELGSDDFTLLALVSALVLGIALADALGNYLADIQLKRAGELIIHELRMATHAHLQRLSLAFHERRHTGDLVTRVTGDVNAVGELFATSLGTLVQSSLIIVGMLVVSLLIDPLLALAAFGLAPLLALVTFSFRRRLRAAARRQRAKEGEIASLTAEAFAAMRVVKAFGSEPFEHERLQRRSLERREAGIEASRIESRFSGAIDLLGALGVVAVLVVGVFRVASGAVTAGDLIVMTSYAKRLYRPLRDIARQAGKISRAMARADRIAEILAADEMLEERPNAYRGPKAQGDLELEQVSFAYQDDRPVLSDLSLRIPAGERVALMGRSGAGKSTLAALIARFYDPPAERGRVLIDGRDARDCSLEWLREQVGLVLQDTVLFTGTVAENIAYGIDADRDAVVAAAKAAGAHGFISELPEGYDTPLGPRGVGLSGGQRQRIAIARTLLRDPPILVLDEPTTGLDRESEAQVLDGLRALMRDRTTIIITHSPTLARTADRVVVVDAGRISGKGRTEAVLEGIGEAPQEGAPRTPAVPADEALPRMPHLLDGEAMAPILQRSLGDGAPPLDVRVRYLRYKPDTNLVVHYDVGFEGRWHDATAMIAAGDSMSRRASKPANLDLARVVNGRSPAPMPLAYDPQLGALIQWLPLDLSLPGLGEPAERLRARLRAAQVKLKEAGDEPTLLAYKPRRRAVVRLDGHVVKVYAREQHFAAAAAGLRKSSSIESLLTPTFEAAVADLRLTVQDYLSGQPVHSDADASEEAGALLATLHASGTDGLPVAMPDHQLEAAVRSARLVSRIAPELGERVARLVDRLGSDLPSGARLVASHGDFSASQLVDCRGELGVTDFDEMCAAPAALDPATYVAHLVRGDGSDVDAAELALEAIVDGYGERPDDLAWYLATAILRRAPHPFRYLDEHWPSQVEGFVGLAESALALDGPGSPAGPR